VTIFYKRCTFKQVVLCYVSLHVERVLPWKSTIILYTTLNRPVVLYASQTWVLSKSDEKAFAVFEGAGLRSIYGPIKDHNGWRIRSNYELYSLYEDMNFITFIKEFLMPK
jgi:hypothetical protein